MRTRAAAKPDPDGNSAGLVTADPSPRAVAMADPKETFSQRERKRAPHREEPTTDKSDSSENGQEPETHGRRTAEFDANAHTG